MTLLRRQSHLSFLGSENVQVWRPGLSPAVFDQSRHNLRRHETAAPQVVRGSLDVTNHPKGIASTTLAKDLKITQKSAWFVLHRLRHAARTNSFNAPLKGTVEADTAFIGGKEGNKHADKRTPGSQGGAGKSVVLGMVEGDGELRATHISEQGEASDHVKRNVERKSVLMTDEDRVFKGKDYLQLTLRHSIGEYVRGAGVIHTCLGASQTPDCRTHHWVSPKHLQKYVDEMSWRFNRRDMKPSPRMNDIFARVEGRLTYKALIASSTRKGRSSIRRFGSI
jgi:ISXO2 transposase-like protein